MTKNGRGIPAPKQETKELTYVPMVEPSGTFVQDWQKKNGSFSGFKRKRLVMIELWESKSGNNMVRVGVADNESEMYNLPAGIFLGYHEEHPSDELVFIDNGEWTINPELPVSYDPIDGLKVVTD